MHGVGEARTWAESTGDAGGTCLTSLSGREAVR